jgi:hypothetical protein
MAIINPARAAEHGRYHDCYRYDCQYPHSIKSAFDHPECWLTFLHYSYNSIKEKGNSMNIITIKAVARKEIARPAKIAQVPRPMVIHQI